MSSEIGETAEKGREKRGLRGTRRKMRSEWGQRRRQTGKWRRVRDRGALVEPCNLSSLFLRACSPTLSHPGV